ncbi:hypothetical protein AVEN_237511-1 [Araneus ventricosus]|uniref:Uncharacterized protein n=1 Tax=Araneus ventricosus TaxID=182803 RepID=A0A4Y2NR10_ARAVE|nr:hypothetical protein AVEN_237511-1 [Araneus ventricosus]
MNDLPPRILIRALWSTHYSPIKPSIHRHSIPSICRNTHFFLPPIQVQKSDTSIHLKFQSALQSLGLVKSIEVPITLAKDPTKDSANEVPEFGFVGNPTFPSRFAVYHRFSTLILVFSFPCSRISILEGIGVACFTSGACDDSLDGGTTRHRRGGYSTPYPVCSHLRSEATAYIYRRVSTSTWDDLRRW